MHQCHRIIGAFLAPTQHPPRTSRTSGGLRAGRLGVLLRVLGVAVLGALASTPATAQCSGSWLVSPSMPPGIQGGAVLAQAVLLNGDIVVAGDFTMAGGRPANRIARWDGSAWHPLGSGMENTVRALAVLPNGDLIAGGNFYTAGGVPNSSRLARWNGSTWSSVPGGLMSPFGFINAIEALPNGEFIVAGSFSGSYNNVARWNGAGWVGFGGGLPREVKAIAVRMNPASMLGYDLLASGSIEGDNRGLSWWTGVGFAPVGGWQQNWEVIGIKVTPSGRIFLLSGTHLTAFASCQFCNFLSDMSWTQLGSPPGQPYAIGVRPNNEVFLGGTFQGQAGSVVRWTGSLWDRVGDSVSGTVYTLATTPTGDLIAGGQFTNAGGVAASGVARWDGTQWSGFNPGLDQSPSVAAVLDDGSVAIGGAFKSYKNSPMNRVARWDGSSLTPLGSGMDNTVLTIAPVAGGMVAGGAFTAADGAPANRIARWDGSAWSALGSGVDGTVHAVTRLFPSGHIIAAGEFLNAGGAPASRIARWNGSAWSALGSGLDGPVYALAQLANGDIVAAGAFTAAGGVSCNRIARWNGTAWAPLGSGLDGVVSVLRALPDGQLLVGGGFTAAGGASASRIARWNGSSWSPLGDGMNGKVRSLAVGADFGSADGVEIIAAGDFTTAGGVTVNRAARWDGSAWTAVGAGWGDGLNGSAYGVVHVEPDEYLFVGPFTTSNGQPASGISRYSRTGVPWCATRPVEQAVSAGDTLTLSATCATGFDFTTPVQFEWRRDGMPLSDGAGGASPGGGFVKGASGSLASNAAITTLVILNAQMSDAGDYAVSFTNPCGSGDSGEVLVTVEAACTADINEDGLVDSSDLSFVLSQWGPSKSAMSADLDRNGWVDSADLGILLSSWGVCP